jgi:hypothetical protein
MNVRADSKSFVIFASHVFEEEIINPLMSVSIEATLN